MPNSVHQARRSDVLTNVAVRFRPPKRRWDRIFRIMPVDQRNGEYPVFDATLYEAPDDFRTDGGEAKTTDIGWKYEPFQCVAHALKTKITAASRKAARGQVDLEALKTEAVKEQVDNNIEKAVFGPNGLLRTAANNAYSANVDWTNPATASPRTNINTVRLAVKKACGRAPNTIAATAEVFLAITGTDEYKEFVPFFENLATSDGIPDKLFGLDTVVVDSQVTTSKKGQTKIPTNFLMGDDVWIGYVADGTEGDEMGDGGPESNVIGPEVLTYGALLQEGEETVTWWEQAIKSDWVEYERVYQLKLIAKECGGLLQSVLTS